MFLPHHLTKNLCREKSVTRLMVQTALLCVNSLIFYDFLKCLLYYGLIHSQIYIYKCCQKKTFCDWVVKFPSSLIEFLDSIFSFHFHRSQLVYLNSIWKLAVLPGIARNEFKLKFEKQHCFSH